MQQVENGLTEIQSTNESKFRIEKDGRIRLILPEKAILIGHYNAELKTLVMRKGKFNTEKRSFTFAVHKEVWDAFPEIEVLAIEIPNHNRWFATSQGRVRMHGFVDPEHAKHHADGQTYVYLDYRHWTELDSFDEILSFKQDMLARNKANRN